MLAVWPITRFPAFRNGGAKGGVPFAVSIIFIIVRVAPGDPAVAALGDNASQEAVDALRERMGLNQPLWQQYATFLGDLARGNLGRSLISQKPVAEQIAFVLPYTLELTFAATLVGLRRVS